MSTQTGSCHCGKVRFEVRGELPPPIACNCSMCGRSGTLLSFVADDAFTLLAGEGALVDYEFNKHVIHHTFCGTCGIKPFARGAKPDGTRMVAVNMRCLDGIDVHTVEATKFSGKDL